MRKAFLLLSLGVLLRAVPLPLMPWPSEMHAVEGTFQTSGPLSVSYSGVGANDPRVGNAAHRFLDSLTQQTGVPFPTTASVTAALRIVVENKDHAGPQRLGDDERYDLRITVDGIRLSANAPLGVLRGLETLLQLANLCGKGNSVCWPLVDIRDEPRFAWRGLSLDVSRHFIPVEGIKRTIDGLAAVKMNVLHWHLTDDEGFRVESKSYPKLHQLGSDGQYYTQAEVREIVAYARDRGVRIVPEFDMPGHSTSWLIGYPSLAARPGPYTMAHGRGDTHGAIDPTKESTYKLLGGVIAEMAKLFPDEYFHIGGDEVEAKEWNTQPAIRSFMKQKKIANAKQLQVYFNQRIQKLVASAGKKMIGWDEIREPNLPKRVIVQSWRGQKYLAEGARQGYAGILSAGYYLDLMHPASQHYVVDPLGGDAAALSESERALILGGEAAMWEELATEENIDAKLWPRTAAIAERLWSPATVVDVVDMYARLGPVSKWLEWQGLTHRSALEMMLTRLSSQIRPLADFASILEPVKNYERHRDGHSSLMPFNRLVDAIPPESDEARAFDASVASYLATKTVEGRTGLRKTLESWTARSAALRSLLGDSEMLQELGPVADSIDIVCRIGRDALDGSITADALKELTEASKHHAHLMLPFADSVKKLAEDYLAATTSR